MKKKYYMGSIRNVTYKMEHIDLEQQYLDSAPLEERCFISMAKDGKLSEIQQLLTFCNVVVCKRNEIMVKLAFFEACSNSRKKVLTWLYEEFSPTINLDICRAFTDSFDKKLFDVCETLLSIDVKSEITLSDTFFQCYIFACRQGFFPHFRWIIATNPFIVSHENYSAGLVFAAENRHISMYRYILKTCIYINKKHLLESLYVAFKSNVSNLITLIIKECIKHGIEYNSDIAVHYTCQTDAYEAFMLLLTCNPTFYSRIDIVKHSLMMCCIYGSYKIFKEIIRNCDVNMLDDDYVDKIFKIACKKNYIRIATELKERMFDSSYMKTLYFKTVGKKITEFYAY